jgi:signal transduction histidine kinase
MICLSLKWRVSLWVTTVLVAVIITISLVAYFEFEESHIREIDKTLEAMANGILASLDSRHSQAELEQEARAVTEASGPNGASFAYRIWMENSSADLLSSDQPDSERGRWLRELSPHNAPTQGQYTLMNIGRRGNEYRAIWMRHIIEGPILQGPHFAKRSQNGNPQKDRKMGIPDNRIVNIVVAGSSHFTFHELHEFLRMLLILGTSLIIGSVVAIAWTVRCGLLPVNATAKRLQDIAHPDVKEAVFNEKKVPSELRPFVRALNDMLARLNSVLQRQKQFTSDAAHELRTPLTAVKSTLQVTQMQQRQPDEYRQAIHIALEDVAQMERLIEQLLILARMDEAGGQTINEQVRLDVLLNELAETFDKKARQEDAKIILAEPPAVTVEGNVDELARLFSNVIDNAVRYGPHGGTVRITLKSENDSYALVSIQDEGGNIPSDAIPSLFDRFYRVDRSRCSLTGGVGLGLAIAREIALRHNGDISMTSSPATGTVVLIRLACK